MSAVFAALLAICGGCERSAPGVYGSRPHIVLILVDDLGWGDVGYHGGTIRTPNIDRLAASGVRLNAFYVLQACTPTRACLLTGRYPMRFGLQEGIIQDRSAVALPETEQTLASALKRAGYRTAICGKWHLGHASPDARPLRRGFDHQYGCYTAGLDHFTRRRIGGLDWYRNEEPLYEVGYSTQLIAAEAVRLIRAHDRTQPLFLYLPFSAPHAPIQAPAEFVEPYAHIEDERARTYAGMVACLDDAIGRIVEALEQRQMRRDTLIVFTSDNGAAVCGSNGAFRGGKRLLYEGGVRMPAIASWPGVLSPDDVDELLHVADWYPTLLALAGVQTDRMLDGRDIWPTLANGAPSPHEDLLINLSPARGAIRAGDFKLLFQAVDGPRRFELYDLARDPGESENLVDRQPEMLRRLRERLDAYASLSVEPLISDYFAGRTRSPATSQPAP